MTTVRSEVQRKFDLIDRYRAMRLEELLEELRPRAVAEAEDDRYPWKGEFRPREEILLLYRRRRFYDRRFLVDMTLVVLVLAAVVSQGNTIIAKLGKAGKGAASAASK
ncbi:MAG: hypothetical protein ACE5H3_00360 [Planctomycetota bacterium]